MIEEVVSVPVSLIDRAYEQSGDMVSESLGRIYEIAHPRRLRVVDLDNLGPRYIAEDGKHMVWLEDVKAAPDVLDVDSLAQIIRRVDGNHDLGAGALAEAIRAAIEEVVDR